MGNLDKRDLSGIKAVLNSLVNKRKWGGAHTEEIHLIRKGITADGLRYCLNHNILLTKKSTGEKHYSLNPKRSGEINRIIYEVNDVSQLEE